MLEWVLTVSSFVENLPDDGSTAQCFSQLYQYCMSCEVRIENFTEH
jgi:hypothetical protein